MIKKTKMVYLCHVLRSVLFVFMLESYGFEKPIHLKSLSYDTVNEL